MHGSCQHSHVEEATAQVAQEDEHNQQLANGEQPPHCDELILLMKQQGAGRPCEMLHATA
jgi:hypothetical protein